MRLEMNTSLLRSDAVLALLRSEVVRQEAVEGSRLYVEVYQNGREQGFAIDAFGPNGNHIWVAWSECRNSDEIVVYSDNNNPMQSVSDAAYKRRQTFASEGDAVAGILFALREFIIQ
jgi:hypothetical protein